ncbi:MAG: hypothetical protein HOV68_14925, partial [Streptomycetaceae bacterium]|nr:hypothetical protein [Streptomycetaceae bacterium]
MRIDDGTLGSAGSSPGRSLLVPGRRRPRGRAVAGLVLSVGLVATGCTSGGGGGDPTPGPGSTGISGLSAEANEIRSKMLRLSSYTNCDALLDDFRKAALAEAKEERAEVGAGSGNGSG